MNFTHATPRTAWQGKGRHHALKNEPPSPPDGKPERDWYMTGYRLGKVERLRKEAEGDE